MATIKVGENETLDSALRRFKRRCARDGIIGDLRKKEQYEKPSVRRKRKPKLQESAARCNSVTKDKLYTIPKIKTAYDLIIVSSLHCTVIFRHKAS